MQREAEQRSCGAGDHGMQLRPLAALAMAWYRPDLYHRVLSYSGTFVNQQWPYNPETPKGAWGFTRV